MSGIVPNSILGYISNKDIMTGFPGSHLIILHADKPGSADV